MTILTPIHPIEEIVEHRQNPEMEETTEALRALAERLRGALEELAVWTEEHTQPFGEEALALSAGELSRCSEALSAAHSELIVYQQQLPAPHDFAIAFQALQALEMLLRYDLARETRCKFDAFGITSWADLLASEEPIDWSPAMIEELQKQIAPLSWQRARELLRQLKPRLP